MLDTFYEFGIAYTNNILVIISFSGTSGPLRCSLWKLQYTCQKECWAYRDANGKTQARRVGRV